MDTPSAHPSLIRTIASRRMLVSLLMGYACGLPLHLTLGVLQAWMKESGVDLTLIGLMSLVGLPYTLKFLWAPIMDRYTLPFLGRRRGWLLVAQGALLISIVALGRTDPLQTPWLVALAALLVTLSSASQDIVVDAYRREDLADAELGFGSSLYVFGYRMGMLLAGGGGLIFADYLPFSMVYAIMAACLLPGILTTLLTPEPQTPEGTPKTLMDAVFQPLAEYLRRPGALWMLAFILFYKIGDTMASAMTMPLYLDLGFTKTQIGAITKIFGLWAVVAGGLVGGVAMMRLGINRSLWVFGFLQALSTAGFALLAQIGPQVAALAGVIAFENISSGMGTAAFVAFMASITNKRFTATQYALLSSLMGIPRVIAAAPTGFLAKYLGWEAFFIVCALIAVPGMLMLLKFAPWGSRRAG
ncbi:MAG: AmpG family muropeptide MFS transporter [Desulfobacterales bacterium]